MFKGVRFRGKFLGLASYSQFSLLPTLKLLLAPDSRSQFLLTNCVRDAGRNLRCEQLRVEREISNNHSYGLYIDRQLSRNLRITH